MFVFSPGAAGIRSTRMVDFHMGKLLHDVKRCHSNAAVFDSDWQRQAGELFGAHPEVKAWVKKCYHSFTLAVRQQVGQESGGCLRYASLLQFSPASDSREMVHPAPAGPLDQC